MNLISRKENSPRFESTHGEIIHELIQKAFGNTAQYSIALADILPNCASKTHYHPVIEEVYYILSGTADMILDEVTTAVNVGDCIAIPPNTRHKIINTGPETLHFLVVCAPGWTSDCSVFLE